MACATCGPTRRCSCAFTVVDDNNIGRSLVASLTPIADSIRNIGVYLGARQYTVTLVWTQWSGGERGSGDELVLATFPLLPTPLVPSLDPIAQQLQSFGEVEVGEIRVSQISPRFSEDTLVGRDIVVQAGLALPDDVSFYWEIYHPETGRPGIRRRFTLSGSPSKHPTQFQWTVMLTRAATDRLRDGSTV